MAFTSTELGHFRQTQEAHMMDTAIIMTISRTGDDYGELVPSYSQGATIPCGVDMRPGSENEASDKTTLTWDATIRVPIATVIDPKDRLRITHRFGEAITPIDFDLAAPPQRGPSGLRLLVKRVEPNSVG